MLDYNIIRLLEEKLTHPLSSSSDCERLALDIESSTGERLGFTTLKRLLGFTSETALPRQSTLEIIARYLGYSSYKSLEEAIANRGDSDFDNKTLSFYSEDLPSNFVIEISYSPNRRLSLQHITNDEFQVIESINGSLKKGDRIFVDSFTSGLPMIVKNVIRGGENLGRYVAGSKYGINISKWPTES